MKDWSSHDKGQLETVCASYCRGASLKESWCSRRLTGAEIAVIVIVVLLVVGGGVGAAVYFLVIRKKGGDDIDVPSDVKSLVTYPLKVLLYGHRKVKKSLLKSQPIRMAIPDGS
jgi:hypothetical protein